MAKITLKIGAQRIDFYNEVSVTMQYDAVASTFGFSFYFDPENAQHREIFRPATYKPASLEMDGELLISGTLLGFKATDSAAETLIQLNGYTKTGVLGDCEIPTSAYPLQTNGLSLKEIAERVTKPFGLKVVVDPAVATECNVKYANVVAKNSDTVQDYLHELAAQKYVMLSHDARGDLLLTRANTAAAPVWNFDGAAPGVMLEIDFDGQRMHSGVTLIKQQTKGKKDGTGKKGNAAKSTFTNPFVPAAVVRPRVNRQTSGRTVDAANAARHMLSDELRGCALKITMQGWTLGGGIVRPNRMITVKSPRLFLYERTRWFIAAVDLTGTESEQTAVLTCFLPSVFGKEEPINIFE